MSKFTPPAATALSSFDQRVLKRLAEPCAVRWHTPLELAEHLRATFAAVAAACSRLHAQRLATPRWSGVDQPAYWTATTIGEHAARELNSDQLRLAV